MAFSVSLSPSHVIISIAKYLFKVYISKPTQKKKNNNRNNTG